MDQVGIEPTLPKKEAFLTTSIFIATSQSVRGLDFVFILATLSSGG